MMDFEFIERLIEALDGSSIDSLEIERGGTRIRLAKTPPISAAAPTMVAATTPGVAAAAPPVASTAAAPGPGGGEATTADDAPAASDLLDITSPMVGTFYRSPAPDAPPYVEVGKRVTPGDTLCIIEAMKLMNELECEVTGKIAEILIENAQPVEFGQVLFRVDPT